MGRKRGGQKSVVVKDGGTKSKKSGCKSERALAAESDSGHVSPVESNTPRENSCDVTPIIRDWKDDIINYYRAESRRAWKLYFAASLERYHALLQMKRWSSDVEFGAEALHMVACGQFTDVQLKQIDALLQKEKIEASNMFDNKETSATKRFITNVLAIDEGHAVSGLPSIDPDIGLEHFQDLIDEGDLTIHEVTGFDREEESLSLSFTGSVDSEDSSAFLTARSTQDDSSEPMIRERKKAMLSREEIHILNPTSRNTQKGQGPANSIGAGKMAPILDALIQNGQNKKAKSDKDAARMVSAMTQYEPGDVESVAPPRVIQKFSVDCTTQTATVPGIVPKPSVKKNVATQITAKPMGQMSGQDESILSSGTAKRLEGDGAPSNIVANKDMTAGKKTTDNKGNGSQAKQSSVTSSSALADARPEKEPKRKAEKTEGSKLCAGKETAKISIQTPAPPGSTKGVSSANGMNKTVTPKKKSSERKTNIDNGSQAERDSVTLSTTLTNATIEYELKREAAAVEALTKAKLKQIDEDARLARELAKAWGSVQDQRVKREPSPVPGLNIRVRHDSQEQLWQHVNKPAKPLSSASPAVTVSGYGASNWAGVTNPASNPVSYSTKQPNRKFSKDSYLNKTSPCWAFNQKGHCPWGDECIFAHGKKELKELPSWFKKEHSQLHQEQQKQLPNHPEPCDVQQCPARLQFFLRNTSICKQWQADRCPYGKECKFAHGRAELKPLPKYEICQRNLAGKCCRKTTECVYAHSDSELRKAPPNLLVHKAAVAAGAKSTHGWGDKLRDQNSQNSIEQWTSNDHDWTNDDCVICSEDFTLECKRFKLTCGHDCFHAKCVSRWINERDPSCPLCRKTVTDLPGMFQPPRGARPTEYPPLA